MKNKNLGMFFSVIIASLVALGAPVLAETVDGSATVTAGNMTISSIEVNGGNAITPDTPVTFAVNVSHDNGFDQIGKAYSRAYVNKSDAIHARNFVLRNAQGGNGVWYRLKYAESFSSQFRTLQEVEGSPWISGADLKEVKIDCPTGNCSEKIRVVPNTTQTEVKYINISDAGRKPFSHPYTFNLTADGDAWQSTALNLTYQQDYWTPVMIPGMQLKEGAVVGVKDDEGDYALLIPALSSSDDTKFTLVGYTSDSPELWQRDAEGLTTHSGAEVGFSGQWDLSFDTYKGGQMTNLDKTQFNVTSGQIRFNMPFSSWYTPDVQANQQLYTFWMKDLNGNDIKTTVDFKGSPGVNVLKSFERTDDPGNPGLEYSIAPGQSGTDSVDWQPLGNVEMTVNVSGTDFNSTGETFSVSNQRAIADNLLGGACNVWTDLTLSNSEQSLTTLYPKNSENAYCTDNHDYYFGGFKNEYSLFVPLGTPTGSYSNTLTVIV